MKSLAVLLLFASLAVGQYQLPPPVHSYLDGSKAAVKEGKPLVVFVGHRPTFDQYLAVTSTATFLEGYPAQCVVIAYPQSGSMCWSATLPMGASKGEVEAAIRKAVAAPAVDPFHAINQRAAIRSSTYCPT